jgi:TRAP-type C4-dicarboxylate transport system substrate-binding protein
VAGNDALAVYRSDPSASSFEEGSVSVNGSRSLAAVAVIAIVVGGGCSSGDKAGGSGGIVTLRLATDDDPTPPASQQIKEFARQVRRLSDGRLRIHVGWQANGTDPRHRRAFDQQTARKVIDGKYELALVPARAWDVFGVTSLQAIQTPFLVNSDALLDKVTSDPVADKMLSGLDDVGVVGLALWPEALRHPVGFGHPLRSRSDFAGKGIRAIRSKLTWEMLRALGALPLDIGGNPMGPAIDSGRIRGAESEIGLVRLGNLARPGIVTANVTLFPRANTIVANRAAFERLTDEQQETLRKAGAETLRRVVASRPTDVEEARSACSAGIQLVVASDADIRGLVLATRPVVARLERDDLTRKAIQRIVALRETVSKARRPIAPCRHPSLAAAKAKAGRRPATLPPDGVYRSLISPQEFVRVGLASQARNNSGLFTLTLRGGRVSWTIRGKPDVCAGRYFLSRGTVRFVMDNPSPCGSGPGNWIFSARWRKEDGGIRFTDVQSSDGPPFDQVAWARLWKRIDVP